MSQFLKCLWNEGQKKDNSENQNNILLYKFLPLFAEPAGRSEEFLHCIKCYEEDKSNLFNSLKAYESFFDDLCLKENKFKSFFKKDKLVKDMLVSLADVSSPKAANIINNFIKIAEAGTKEENKPQETKPLERNSQNEKILNEEIEFKKHAVDFNQELLLYKTFDHNDLLSSYNIAKEISPKKLKEKHQSKLERYLTDDERFLALWMECNGNAGLSFNINRDEFFAEIKKDDKILAICPIQSITTQYDTHKDTIINFVNNHKEKGAKIIFSLHGGGHYKTLALDPETKKYRYIDSLLDSEDGVANVALKNVINELGYSPFGCSYQKQQYSENLEKESKGTISHNNECAFHNVYTTIRIAQESLKADLSKMNEFKMKMLGMNQENLTPELARDHIRPFYEEVFERLRNVISKQKEVLPNPSPNSISSQNLFSGRVVKGSNIEDSAPKSERYNYTG